MKPILLINFKTYEQGTGKKALAIAKAADLAARKTGANVILSVQPTDLKDVSKAVSIPVYAQHMDPIKPGSHTGWILPEAVKDAGAKGTLINHSEHNLDTDIISANIEKCKELKIVSVCCAATPKIATELAAFSPDFIAIEPPELIGGDISVAQAKPEIISDTVKAVKSVNPKVKVLCGAGVNSTEDVMEALELGAVGVLVASAIVKSAAPGKVIESLIKGF
ncbi:MAG: triose-phosphate isomerase [Candidatus Aenigmarchaeota archaeon]|nr:triose-phosphate isomerase [Candidatus Aenigmarchaeota archaeon]